VCRCIDDGFLQDVVLPVLSDVAADVLLAPNSSSSNGHFRRRSRRQLQQQTLQQDGQQQLQIQQQQELHVEQLPDVSNGLTPAVLQEQQGLWQHIEQQAMPLQQQLLHEQQEHQAQQPGQLQVQQQQQQQQEQNQHHPQRMQRQWSTMRNWQWLASQLHCSSSGNGSSSSSSGSTSLQALVSMLTQLSQPGVGPSQHDKQQQQRFRAFLAQLLLAVQQQLQAAAAAGDAAAVAPEDVADLLWGLAKLGVKPQWTEPQQQQQQQFLQRGVLPAAQLLPQRVAEVTATAVKCFTALLQKQQQQQQRQQQWDGVALLPPLYTPRQLALSIWALAKLDYPVEQQQQQQQLDGLLKPDDQQQQQSFWGPYLSAVQQQLHCCSCQDLSNIIWAIAQLDCRPSPAWIDSYLAAVRQTFSSSSSSSRGQALSVVMLSLAQMGEQPRAEWIDAVLTSLLQPLQQQHSRQQQQQQQPRRNRHWQQQEQEQQLDNMMLLLHQLDGQSLASLLGALAIWRHRPSNTWLAAVQDALLYCLPRCNGQDVAHVTWKLATLLQLPSSSSSSSSAHWSAEEQESGLAMLQRQLASSSSSLHYTASLPGHLAPQQQPQQGALQPELLQQLAYQLADTAGSSHPCMVAQGMWGIAKLYQLAQPTPAPAAACPQGMSAEDVARGVQPVQQQQQHLSGGSSSSSGEQALRQHWQPCRAALLHCAAALQQRQALAALDCKHLALVAWGLALAGGETQQQQQPQQQQDDRRRSVVTGSSRDSRYSIGRSSSKNSSSRFAVPHQFVQQVLNASRLSLAVADSHSQALLLSAAVQLQLQPSWQWLLGFYEATVPQLNRCSVQDLSMMAAALAQLQVRPLGSWLARFLDAFKTLAELQPSSLTPGCLVSVVQALAAPCWGLAAQGRQNPSSGQLQEQQQQQQQQELLSPGWTAAVQQQVLQQLPQLSLQQVVLLLRAAARLGWVQQTSGSSSTSSIMSADGAAVVAGLLGASLEQLQQQQQQQVQHSLPAKDQLQQLLQLSSAAAALPAAAAVPADWWLHVAQQLSEILTQQQQQQGFVASCTAEDLCSDIRTLAGIISRKQQQSLQGQQQQQQQALSLLYNCLEAFLVAADQQVQHLPLSQSVQLVAAATESIRLLQASRRGNTQHTSTAAAAGCAAGVAAVQQLRGSVQQVLQQQLPELNLQELAVMLHQASQLELLLPPQSSSSAVAARSDSAASLAAASTGAGLMAAVVSAVEVQLGLLEQQQQQLALHLQQQQQLNAVHQHQQMYRCSALMSSSSSSSSSELHAVTQLRTPLAAPASAAPAAAASAGYVADILAAFGRSSFRPPRASLLRLLAALQPGLSQLDATQLSGVAAAAAALGLGKLAGRPFRDAYWRALSAMLRPQQQQQQQQQQESVARRRLSNTRRLAATSAAPVPSRSTASSSSSSSSSRSMRVLLVLKSLNALAAGCNPNSRDASISSGSSSHADALGINSGRALGAPPPRKLIELAFSAAATVLPQLSSSPGQQVLLLQLLVPLAARLSADGLRSFHLRLRQQLQLQSLPQAERAQAYAAMQQLVESWKAGRQQREQQMARVRLLKQQRQQQMGLVSAAAAEPCRINGGGLRQVAAYEEHVVLYSSSREGSWL
jgi:hypothetical protein